MYTQNVKVSHGGECCRYQQVGTDASILTFRKARDYDRELDRSRRARLEAKSHGFQCWLYLCLYVNYWFDSDVLRTPYIHSVCSLMYTWIGLFRFARKLHYTSNSSSIRHPVPREAAVNSHHAINPRPVDLATGWRNLTCQLYIPSNWRDTWRELWRARLCT